MTEPDWPAADDSSPAIEFHDEDAGFLPEAQPAIDEWIRTIITRESCTLHHINYIFCSDDHLHQINLEYLDHDTYTDIITFPYDEPPRIHSDIFISVDRVRENAAQLGLPFDTEMRRVMIHGVLHLCGYPDKTPEEAQRMREKEDEALSLYPGP